MVREKYCYTNNKYKKENQTCDTFVSDGYYNSCSFIQFQEADTQNTGLIV